MLLTPYLRLERLLLNKANLIPARVSWVGRSGGGMGVEEEGDLSMGLKRRKEAGHLAWESKRIKGDCELVYSHIYIYICFQEMRPLDNFNKYF